ncbi:hypothetical protein AKJ09_05010 [Labilithrix luteola]|uniref:Uncharacterized protein n=1 Tax=Labilithrix luteola TaxID=1391654 RepID=A0A0K1PY94_9BACT|nr:ABC transporter substrate-binding protein [Labilithrix luteola]AKU98346.1 hypothetical protein AKJ09_05010 [Labilithrix luteola]
MIARRTFVVGLGSLLFGVPLSASAQKKEGPKDKDKTRDESDQVERVVKQLVAAVREGRDDDARRLIDFQSQAEFIFGADWPKATPAQRDEFLQRYGRVFGATMFPKVRDHFKQVSSITYEQAEVVGTDAHLKSTEFIKQPPKTQELKLEYVLKKRGQWRVFDVMLLAGSILTLVRDDIVRPVLQTRGWDGVMTELRAKDAALSAPKP